MLWLTQRGLIYVSRQGDVLRRGALETEGRAVKMPVGKVTQTAWGQVVRQRHRVDPPIKTPVISDHRSRDNGLDHH